VFLLLSPLVSTIRAETHTDFNSSPGPIWTPLVPSTFTKENIEQFGGTPMGRAGQPVEVATCCVFLACEDSSFISGNMASPILSELDFEEEKIDCDGG
jgi:NAD(P)-dependent dehydrogenase (short-subunit alcohol dehydrogenase family)